MATNGLDVLLAPQPAASGPANGLDVLLGAPMPAQQPAPPATAPNGYVQGAKDTLNAAAQDLYNSLGKGVQSAGDSVDHWLYDKTGGTVGTKPGLTFNNAIWDQNKNYDTQRTAAGGSGVDWPRATGSASAQMLATTLMGAGPTSAGGAGFLGGALTPVTNIAPNQDAATQFAWEKAKQSGMGFGIGKVLGAFGNGLLTVASPVLDKGAKLLSDAGISLTPGQALGGFVKSIEDKAMSYPILGDAINAARARGNDDLNKAAYQRVLSPLAAAGFDANMPQKVGSTGVASITDAVKGAYNSLIPKLSLTVDDQLNGELSSLRNMAAKGLPPEQLAEFNRIYGNVVQPNIVAGQSSGQFLQGMLTDLGSKARGYATDPSFANRQLGDALSTIDQSIRQGLQRSNPEYAGKLAAVNEAFANLARVQTAAQSALTNDSVFNANQLARSVRQHDDTVRNNATATGTALMQDLAGPASQILPSKIADSGTAGRLNLTEPATWAGALLSPLYSPTAQRITQNVLTSARPAPVQMMANALRNNSQQTAKMLTPEMINAISSYLKNRDAAQ